jgi:hypothetical protein
MLTRCVGGMPNIISGRRSRHPQRRRESGGGSCGGGGSCSLGAIGSLSGTLMERLKEGNHDDDDSLGDASELGDEDGSESVARIRIDACIRSR